jgi:predicted  nucleic acid-binding Zn-ribbon protein
MTRSEYQELVEFLAPKFDAIDRRFDAIDRRFDAIEERLTRVEVNVEQNRHQIQILAEAVGALDRKLDRELSLVRREMADGFQVQGRVIQGLAARLDLWEGHRA